MGDLAERLGQASNVSIVSPAGCGKTELIARSVKVGAGRQLVLTHTHAGVNALRSRMHKYRVPSKQYALETLDGWCLKFAAAFPDMSQIEDRRPVDEEWPAVRQAACQLLGNRNVRLVLTASYDGLYVDEYQDCTMDQHRLVCALTQILPTRVFGDPLQAIFSFKGNEIVRWEDDVEQRFPRLDTLTTPYRWQHANTELGAWLLQLRRCILEDREVDLCRAPICWQQGSANQCQRGCSQCTVCRAHPLGDTVILFKKWNSACRDVARRTGRYEAIEEMACKRLLDFADALGASLGTPEVLRVDLANFVGLCYTCKDEILRSARVREALERVINCSEVSAVLHFLEAVEACGNGRRFCSDLWFDAKRALQRRHIDVQAHAGTLRDAAWAAREQTRRIGRGLPKRLASTTLLVKGQQFDHAVIAEADNMRCDSGSQDTLLGAKNFYVAATRASKSLTILSSSPIIPKWKA